MSAPGRRQGFRANVEWETREVTPFTWEHVMVEVLMDIRAELREIRESLEVLRCPNFTGIPATLRTIARKLPPRPKAKEVGK